MSDFREKLVALGEGDASLDEVFESLDQLIAVTPHEVASAKELVESAKSGGLSETIRQIQAFQLVRTSKGTEATPSGWVPGKPTLKPSPELVGKIWEVWSADEALD